MPPAREFGTWVRSPAVAGVFYPGDADALAEAVDRLVAGAPDPPPGDPPTAVIAPHAGYRYSGPTAGAAKSPVTPACTRAGVFGMARTIAACPPSQRENEFGVQNLIQQAGGVSNTPPPPPKK